MKFLFIFSLSIVLALSCKHDHSASGHSHDADHGHSHAEEAAHDHDGHNHDHAEHNHDHAGHNHDGHNHDGHDHDGHNHDGYNHEKSSAAPILSKAEIASGWKSLFDGRSISEWRGFKEDISKKWVVDNGTLHFNSDIKGKGGDIISKKEYEDFELSLEWMVQDCGNSGIFWNVVENEKYKRTFHTGPEMQILDNKCHPDAKIRTHRAGDLYDLIETSTVNVKPAMQWNHITIQSNDGHYVFSQNGEKVVEFTMHTPEWDAMIAKSKFKDMDGFAKAKKGHLALQDHGDKVWFRNIKIREI